MHQYENQSVKSAKCMYAIATQNIKTVQPNTKIKQTMFSVLVELLQKDTTRELGTATEGKTEKTVPCPLCAGWFHQQRRGASWHPPPHSPSRMSTLAAVHPEHVQGCTHTHTHTHTHTRTHTHTTHDITHISLSKYCNTSMYEY